MDQQLLDRVLQCPRLPSLPATALEVIELSRQPDSDIKQIAQVISRDAALAAKILKTVNSSFYGLSQRVSTVSHALVILGLNRVKSLALGFSLVGTFRDKSNVAYDLSGFWQRSVLSAAAARTSARSANLLACEEAFLGGLLKDLGILAMLQTLQSEYVELIREVGEQHHDLWRVERERLGADHAQVGAALGEHWQLPPVLIAPIRWHEQPGSAPSDVQAMVQAVAVSSQAASVLVDRDALALKRFYGGLREHLQLDDTAGDHILHTTEHVGQELAKLFEVNCNPPREVQSILAEANERLLELSLQSQQNASELEHRNAELQERALHDALTGVASRGRFDTFLAEQLRCANNVGALVGLALLDIDRFKAINDTHGHQAGDHVLRKLAEILQAHAPSDALVARYGGEEFAVVVPGLDRKACARLAERTRQAIEQTPVDCGDGLVLNVTASLGVACGGASHDLDSPAQLTAAADKAVYAAKHAGRNCVRVFAARRAPACS
ncbi:MAG: HDOD domain-containing protein [Alphaproteobacteria bacterium]|jgi:diguanylate cyclase (GGDEF)-like protein|nr:HDOD domain-containing protein [Alphaproteobacteria bacterium]